MATTINFSAYSKLLEENLVWLLNQPMNQGSQGVGMKSISELTPADVPTLTGDELDRAVEWWVFGDDLSVDDSGNHRGRMFAMRDGIVNQAYGYSPRPFHRDANLCLTFWEPGRVLRGFDVRFPFSEDGKFAAGEWCSDVADSGWPFEYWKPLEVVGGAKIDGTTFPEAAARAAVLAGMRRTGT